MKSRAARRAAKRARRARRKARRGDERAVEPTTAAMRSVAGAIATRELQADLLEVQRAYDAREIDKAEYETRMRRIEERDAELERECQELERVSARPR